MTARATHEHSRSVRGRLGRIRWSVARLSPLVGQHRGAVVAIAAGSAGAGLAEAVLLAVIAQIATAMSMGSDRPAVSLGPIDLDAQVPALLAIAAVLAAIRLLLQIVVARLPARLSGEVQSQLRTQLFDAYLTASWSEQAKEREGHLQELMGGQASQAGTSVLQLANCSSAALMFLTLALSAFILNAGVAAAVMGTAALLFAGLRPLSRQVRRRSGATSAASLSQAHGVAESVRMAEEVYAFGTVSAERARIRSLIQSYQETFITMRTLSRIVPVIYETAILVLLISGLSLLYAIGTARLATLGAVVLLLLRAASHGQQFQTAYQGLAETLPYLDRLSGTIERYSRNRRRQGGLHIDSIRIVEFDSVFFAYKPDTHVLRAVSFAITSGEVVGVVGPTGAGKSTLVQLLLRLREPTAGSYRVNGVAAGEIEDEVWHRKVAYLPQEPHLLSSTVVENVRFFRNWVDDDAIERAAKLAHIHEDIMSWPDGYQTVVGQRADAVSGGQRQRLCLARALAGDPELLILDEPTSALDGQSERLIQESLEELRGNLTMIIVAHRLTTLNLCGRVMVIRRGHLEAFEPRELLYDSNEFFRRAVDLAAYGNPS